MGAQKEIGRAMPAPTPINDRAVQNRRIGPMSTRKGQAASVTLLRREQLRSASAPASPSQALRRGGKTPPGAIPVVFGVQQ